MEPGRRRDHSGCVEGDGGVGGEGWHDIMAALQTEKQKKCGGVQGLLSHAITSVDPTLFQIELARFHCKKSIPI